MDYILKDEISHVSEMTFITFYLRSQKSSCSYESVITSHIFNEVPMCFDFSNLDLIFWDTVTQMSDFNSLTSFSS
jgi:hypothetical protein